MENRLLFINQRPDVVAEFEKAFETEEFQVEIARSGREGCQKILTADYKLVVTSMLLDDIDGIKILQFLKERNPSTICMVYTTKLSVAHMAYLMNNLHVFKIFLRPADYRGEMLEAILEAFDQYDINEITGAERQEREETSKKQQEKYLDIKRKTMKQEEADRSVLKIMNSVMDVLANHEHNLTDEENKHILMMQQLFLDNYLKENAVPATNFAALEAKLRHAIFNGIPGRVLNLDTGSTLVSLSETFVEHLYMCLWLIAYRSTLLCQEYTMKVRLRFETSTIIDVDITLVYPDGVMEQSNKMNISRIVTVLVEHTVFSMCKQHSRMELDNGVHYSLVMDTNEEAVFNSML